MIPNLALTNLNSVSALLASIITSGVAGARRGSGRRLVKRNVNGTITKLFYNIPNTKTAVQAIIGVGTKKHARLSKVFRTVLLLLVLLYLKPVIGCIPLSILTNVLVAIN